MKFIPLLLVLLFQLTVPNAKWSLVATDPAVPNALAIDSCGDGFSRAVNRVYPTTGQGQNWGNALDVPGLMNPSYVFNSEGRNVHLSVCPTKSGLLLDYNLGVMAALRKVQIHFQGVVVIMI